MDEQSRLGFGAVAELYDRARPSYPVAVVDDLVALAGDPPGRVLEVGAGTGKATVLFASRGVQIDAIEPSAEMAAVAVRHLAAYADVRVVVAEFERWSPPAEPYRLLISAQAWHWIDPEHRGALARAVLAPGGVLAAFWNRPVWEECALLAELQAVYERWVPEMRGQNVMFPTTEASATAGWENWQLEVDAVSGLAEPEQRRYPWSAIYTTDEYVALLASHTDHPPELLSEVGEVIASAGGVLDLPHATVVRLARAV